MTKYRNKKTVVDNITFDSMKEAARYQDLKLLERGSEISDLVLQPSFKIEINGQKICTYKADFAYADNSQPCRYVVEDVKGMKTPVYNLKKKLMKAVLGIEVKET